MSHGSSFTVEAAISAAASRSSGRYTVPWRMTATTAGLSAMRSSGLPLTGTVSAAAPGRSRPREDWPMKAAASDVAARSACVGESQASTSRCRSAVWANSGSPQTLRSCEEMRSAARRGYGGSLPRAGSRTAGSRRQPRIAIFSQLLSQPAGCVGQISARTPSRWKNSSIPALPATRTPLPEQCIVRWGTFAVEHPRCSAGESTAGRVAATHV
jgi:hypothetical protein